MNRISSSFRAFFAAVALAVFALPAWSAQPTKQYSLDMQLSGTVGYWSTLGTPPPGGAGPISIPSGGTTVYATLTNQTQDGGNSAINSFKLTVPTGWTISQWQAPPGTIFDPPSGSLSAGGILKVSNISGLQPKLVQGIHAITISFTLTPTSCTSADVLDWTSQLIVTTGTFSNTTFAPIKPTGMNQGTKTLGCVFAVSKTYDVAPTGSGAVTVSLSCTSGVVAAPTSKSATPGTPATFTVTGFSAGTTCTATETASSMPPGYDVNPNKSCTGALATSGAGSCTIANLVNRYTLTYNPGTGGTISGTTPQTNVPYGGSGSAVTAVPSSGYRFVKWSPDDSTTAARTDTNVTSNLTFEAVFGGTLSFTTPPHDAVVGNQIGPVVVACNNFPAGMTVTLTIDGAVPLTGTTTETCVSGAATFNNVATGAGTTAGLHTFTATANDGAPTSTTATATANANLTASNGILWCTESGSGPAGSQIDFGSPNPAIALSGTRYPNKDGSPCIAVNFSVQVEVTPTQKKVTILWDEVTQPNLTMKLSVTWPPELVGGDLLPKPTVYDIGYGPYTVGTCHKKTPAYPTDPDNPPEKVAQVAALINASAPNSPDTIALTINGAWPNSYPFSIIVPSTDPLNPERMRVTGSPSSGMYTVVRGTGLTLASAHAAGLPAMWTPLPLDDGSGINAPAGGQDQVCSISDTYAAMPQDSCPAQLPVDAEPVPCLQATQKLWAIGDLQMSRN